jgi:hypothetical protein
MIFKSSSQTTTTTSKDPLEDVYVTDYLQEWITAGNGSNLFHHVYEPIDSKPDTIVHIDNLAEANNFSSVVLSELARVMNTPAKALVIADLPAAEAGTKKPKWQPYTKAAKLMVERNNMTYYPNTRRRTEGQNTPPSKQPTANPTASPPVINNPTNTNVWKTIPTSTSDTLKEDTIEEIKAHVQAQIEKNNKVIWDEINDSNQTMNKRIGT